MKRYALLYQNGHANVMRFDDDGKPSRVLQADFRTCEDFCMGLLEARCVVRSMHWDYTGDALTNPTAWAYGKGDAFRRDRTPPYTGHFEGVVDLFAPVAAEVQP